MSMVVLMGGLELCFSYLFFNGETTETLGGSGAFWFITWCLTPCPFFLANRFLAWAHQPLSQPHSLFFALRDWNKGKTWFSNWPFPFDKLFKLCFAWNEARLCRRLQRLELLLLCLNLGIKSNTVMSYVCAIHPHFCQDLTVLHCFQIKDVLEKTDRKIGPQEAFHGSINVRITLKKMRNNIWTRLRKGK